MSASVDETAFRQAVAHFATGVTVITTISDGKPAGMTASAVASLSLDPVLLLVCIDNRLPTHTAIENSRRFVVNVLGQGQEDLALRFARPAVDKFAGIALREGAELPVLEDAIAYFVCDLAERFPGRRPLDLHRARARVRRGAGQAAAALLPEPLRRAPRPAHRAAAGRTRLGHALAERDRRVPARGGRASSGRGR